MNSTPKLFSTVVPGGMTMEEWESGGFSTFNHGNSDCSEEVSKAIEKFKGYLKDLLTQYPMPKYLEIVGQINDYKP